jgi:hypothetical protein
VEPKYAKIEGKNLAQLFEENQVLRPSMVVHILKQLLKTLEFLN